MTTTRRKYTTLEVHLGPEESARWSDDTFQETLRRRFLVSGLASSVRIIADGGRELVTWKNARAIVEDTTLAELEAHLDQNALTVRRTALGWIAKLLLSATGDEISGSDQRTLALAVADVIGKDVS